MTTAMFDIVNPADESVVTSVPELEAGDVDDAVERARTAQRRWAELAPADRAAA